MKKVLLLSILLVMSVLVFGQTKVLIETTMGKIKIILYDDTPAHRDNFLKNIEAGVYDNLLFHRVIRNFMIQGGDPQSKDAPQGVRLGAGDLGYTIEAEINPAHYHKRGALAAARQPDFVNPQKRSSSCQFYIVQGRQYVDQELDMIEKKMESILDKPFRFSQEARNDYRTFGGTPQLDEQYTVFGEVVEGFDVVRKISLVQTDENDRPLEDVKILNIKVIKK